MDMIPRHSPVSDQEYYNALSEQGLQLADHLLQRDYERLAQADLPVRDTVSGLLQVQVLQQSEVRT